MSQIDIKIGNKIKDLRRKLGLQAKKLAEQIGLEVHAGHGLDYKTTAILSRLKQIEEFNIGHFIIGESVLHGIKKTIKKFKKILNK